MRWVIRDKKVLVTGGSSGIGLAAATALAKQGADVTITSRDALRSITAAKTIAESTRRHVDAETLDLADLSSVKSFSRRFVRENDQIDVLINNAGGVFGSRRETVDGNEMTFGTNHLGPFLLTSLLSESLGRRGPSMVINVSSVAHTYAKEGILFDDLKWENHRYTMMAVYGHSKLANILHATGINKRTDDAVTAYALHPGVVGTYFGRGGSRIVRMFTRYGKRWMRTPREGADTAVWLATEPVIDVSRGIYFSDRAPTRSTLFARDIDQADRLWSASEKLVYPD